MPFEMCTRYANLLPRRFSTFASMAENMQCHRQDMLITCAHSKRHALTKLIKACGDQGDRPQGKKVHVDAQNEGFASDSFVASALVSMYGKCGSIGEAEDVFNAVFEPDVVLWNAMVSAYVKHGQGEKALLLYRQMQAEGVSANLLTYVGALQACGNLAERDRFQNVNGNPIRLRCLEIGRALHSEAYRRGVTLDARINTTLVSMYAKCGTLLEAENVFSSVCLLSVVLWNAMISAYVENGEVKKVLWLYKEMEVHGIKPDHLTIVFALQACRILAERDTALSMHGKSTKDGSLEIGRALHEAAQSRGLTGNVFVGTTLVNVYGKCDSIEDAEEVFNAMRERTIVSWNAMLSAYIEQGYVEKALLLYRQMKKEGLIPDQKSIVFALQACGMLMEREKARANCQPAILTPISVLGRALHAEVRNMGIAL